MSSFYGPARRTPVTYSLLSTLALVFMVQVFQPELMGDLAFVPGELADRPYQFVTGAFLHADASHLVLNLLSLWVVGAALERLLGSWVLAAVYAVALVAGQSFVVWLSNPNVVTVGASGAIYGLFGALLVADVWLKQWRSLWASVGLIGFNFVYSFMVPNISWEAHLGGFLGGALVAVPVLLVVRSVARRRTAAAQAAYADAVAHGQYHNGWYYQGQPAPLETPVRSTNGSTPNMY